MSDFIQRSITYFRKSGAQNTAELCRIVGNRLKEGDIHAVVVATSTGMTALKMAASVSRGTRIIAVNFQSAHWCEHTRPDPEVQRQAEEKGVLFMPEKPVAKFLNDVPEHSHNLLKGLGQGIKVAVEVVMQAVEVGHILSGEKVIGVGGTSRGADVALVTLAAGPDELSKMWVSEILAKPL